MLAALALLMQTAAAPVTCDARWHDAARDRDVPVRIRMPAGDARVPVILFSHGLGGSLEGGKAWAEHWAANGFAVVNIQHPGSDRSVWENEKRPLRARRALKRAANADQLIARAGDVRFVLDELARRRTEGACRLDRIDLARVGMSGHSFGASTTQAVAGQRYPGGRTLGDPRVKAAIAFSPGAPQGRARTPDAFSAITMPFFSITGSKDDSPIGGNEAADRVVPYEQMPGGGKYLLVLDGADHMDLSGNPGEGRRGRGPTTPYDDRIRDATLLFWRATLLGDASARARLDGMRFGAKDRFAHK